MCKPVVTAPEALAAPQKTLDKGSHYAAVLFWNTNEEVFGFNTAYTASISLTPSPHQGYVFDKDVIESIRIAMEAEGWKVYGNEKSLSMSKTFEPTRKADLTITPADQTITYGEAIDGSGNSFVCELPDVQVTAGLVPSTQQPTVNGQITLAEVVVTDAAGMDITDTLNIQSNTAKLTVNRRPVVFTAQAQTIVYGQTISGSAYIADGLLEGHNAVVSLTSGTGNVTANGTITPSGAVIAADSTDVTANYEISYVTGKLVIKPDTSKIDSLTTENVTSANETDIQAVLEMMTDAETEGSDEETLAAWALITAKCEELIERIEAVKAENERIAEAVDQHELSSVKASDEAAIVQLISDIDEQLATSNSIAKFYRKYSGQCRVILSR